MSTVWSRGRTQITPKSQAQLQRDDAEPPEEDMVDDASSVGVGSWRDMIPCRWRSSTRLLHSTTTRWPRRVVGSDACPVRVRLEASTKGRCARTDLGALANIPTWCRHGLDQTTSNSPNRDDARPRLPVSRDSLLRSSTAGCRCPCETGEAHDREFLGLKPGGTHETHVRHHAIGACDEHSIHHRGPLRVYLR